MVPMVDGPIMAILQATVAPEVQGRVFSVMNSPLLITSPIGLAAAGPVSDWVGLQVWYVTAGVLCTAVGLVGFFTPALFHIEENAEGHSAFAEDRQVANSAAAPPDESSDDIA